MGIKRLVFDLDNTLIPWEDRFNDEIKNSILSIGCDVNDSNYKAVLNVIKEYDKYYNKFNKEYFMSLVNDRLSVRLPYSFMDVWLDNLGRCVPRFQDESMFEALKYLKDRYEMVVFTNWFKCSQEQRLKNAGLIHFFDDIIATDDVLVKPYSEGFVKSCGCHDFSECLMIGDDIENDIMGADIIGMKTILVDEKNQVKNYDGQKISHVKELVKIL